MPLTVDNMRQADAVATADQNAPVSSSTSGDPIQVLAIDDNEELNYKYSKKLK